MVDRDELMTLAEAAAAIGCHVATLRRRSRSGQLATTRGARGQEFVRRDAIAGLHGDPPSRGRPRRGAEVVTDEDLSNARGLIMGALSHRDFDLEYVLGVLDHPERDPVTYRFALAHGLTWEGVSRGAVARHLGVTERHLRRLLGWALEYGLSPMVYRRLAREERERRDRRIKRSLRAVEAKLAGAPKPHVSKRYNRILPYRPTRPRLIKPPPTPATIAYLRGAGLTAEEIDAVVIVGLPAEHLNELLLLGSRLPVDPTDS
jgi:hypothetical protein